MKKQIWLSLILSAILFSQSMEEAFEGFEDDPIPTAEVLDDTLMDGFDDDISSEVEEERTQLMENLTAKISQQLAYSYRAHTPHDGLSSFKSSLFLDYEHKFENGFRFKTNVKAYYDAIYDLSDETYTKEELAAQRSEVELFDAYIEGSLTESLDVKLGRQVVVWGRSDTIRISDILNPLDNRRIGMVDIEDLRLPTTMLKFDYFIADWRVTPIAILEQRFSKNPAFGSVFSFSDFAAPKDEDYTDVTYALSVGAEFSAWDINFYAANVRDDRGYIKLALSANSTVKHDKLSMFGSALNVLWGAWLFKMELAYLDGLKYSNTAEEEFSRTDALLGFEYRGIADTTMSYDASLRHFNTYDERLSNEVLAIDKNTYQHAFRVSSDFMNAKVTANYLLSLYGTALDDGGLQRAWLKYQLGEGINTNIGLVDYMGGSKLFNSIKNNDTVFADISYNF